MYDSDKLKPAFDEACEALAQALKMDEVDEKAKLAISTVSAYSKLKATERAGQTLQYVIIKDFAQENGEVLKEMVQKSLPELNPQAQLTT